jgi:hypothetical protein
MLIVPFSNEEGSTGSTIRIITITLIVAPPMVFQGQSELLLHQKRLSERALVV